VGDGTSIKQSAGGRFSWRSESLVFAVTLLLMLWPLAINRAPFYSADSASYLHGGEFGFNTGLLILNHWWQSLFASSTSAAAASDPKAIVAGAIAESGGARSLIYSVVTYLLRVPGISLIALAATQAALVVLVMSFLRRLIFPSGAIRESLAIGAGLAFLTTASWYAAYAMPDVLAGVTIAGSVVLTVFFDRMNLPARVALVLLVAASVTTHGSHLPIALGTLVAGAAANFWLQRGSAVAWLRKALWFASPLALAVIILLGASYAAFGQASLAPKRYPIQLARSVADGPGAWYLRDHCATEHYAICEVFGPNPPRKVGDFLWGPNGVRYRATPEQMERIRAEESTIVRRAAMEYPLVQIGSSIRNTARQLNQFSPDDLVFGGEMVGTDDPSIVQVRPDRPGLKTAGTVIVYVTFVASILLLFVIRRRLSRIDVAAIAVAVVGLLANAAVCGILSGVTDRYQGRVAWILPGLTFIILARLWSEGRRAPASAGLV
jgi:hypothetical protein